MSDMTREELQQPLTAIEMAELATAATKPDHQLGEIGIRMLRRLMFTCDGLQAFKNWVHAYLDDKGVPYHPAGSHGSEGCRIGDRMDWVFANLVKSYFRSVLEFHQVFGIPVGDIPKMLDGPARLRRDALEGEEMSELNDAVLAGDLPAIADAIADAVYVLLGRAVEMGIDMDRVWTEVHRANMAKIGGEKRADGKHLKPPGWTPPDIDGVLKSQGPLNVRCRDAKSW